MLMSVMIDVGAMGGENVSRPSFAVDGLDHRR
jgi:hypothetical protein